MEACFPTCVEPNDSAVAMDKDLKPVKSKNYGDVWINFPSMKKSSHSSKYSIFFCIVSFFARNSFLFKNDITRKLINYLFY